VSGISSATLSAIESEQSKRHTDTTEARDPLDAGKGGRAALPARRRYQGVNLPAAA
jgi:hypothetical protein